MTDSANRKPIFIVQALVVLLACQLAGEVLVGLLRQIAPAIAFPGPVVGMLLLFVILVWRRGPDAGLDATGTTLLRNLSLLFVPAAVGIVQQGEVLSQFGLPLIAALLVSTVLTLLVTVGVFLAVSRRFSRGDAE